MIANIVVRSEDLDVVNTAPDLSNDQYSIIRDTIDYALAKAYAEASKLNGGIADGSFTNMVVALVGQRLGTLGANHIEEAMAFLPEVVHAEAAEILASLETGYSRGLSLSFGMHFGVGLSQVSQEQADGFATPFPVRVIPTSEEVFDGLLATLD